MYIYKVAKSLGFSFGQEKNKSKPKALASCAHGNSTFPCLRTTLSQTVVTHLRKNMGLDWKPLNKPKKGMENEFKDLFEILDGRKKTKLSFFDKIIGKKSYNETEVQNRFFEISTTPYETLNAPRVGFDIKATEWAKQSFENRTDKGRNLEEFMKEMYGYWVVVINSSKK